MAARASGILLVLVSAWLFGSSSSSAQGVGAPAAPTASEIADLSAKLKALTATLDKDGEKAVLALSDAIGLINALDKIAGKPGETADTATIKSFLTLLEKIQQGTPDQRKTFSENTDVVASKDKLLQFFPPPVPTLEDAVSKVGEIVKAATFAPAAGVTQAGKLLETVDVLFGASREQLVLALADKLTAKIPELGPRIVADIKASIPKKEPYAKLNEKLQTIIGSSDLKVHIISAAYGDRFLLENFVKTGKAQSPGNKSRWCNATAAMRTQCERKGGCAAGALNSLCGFDPAEFTEPRYKGVLVNYVCIQNSDVGFWTQPTANVSAYDAVTFNRRRPGDIVFLGSPTAQLACEVTP